LLVTAGSSSRMVSPDLCSRGLERFAELARARPVAVEPLAVDEERRRPVHPTAYAGREVGRNALLEAAALEIRLNVGRVRTRRCGVLQQVRSIERVRRILLMLEDGVMHSPVRVRPHVCGYALRCLRSFHRIRM